MRVSKVARCLCGLVAALALAASSANGTEPCLAGSATAQRVVSIGDVHGSFTGLVQILTATGLVDDDLHWTGGSATLVQTGDLLDRGVDVREVMDLLIRLQQESRTAGGRVICLIGNHEALNLLGIRREVNPEVYSRFAGRHSEERQKSAWRQQLGVWKKRVARSGRVMAGIPDETRAKWLESHPPGTFEYMDALGPRGEYGRWLRSCPVAVVVGETLFMHGGLSPSVRGLTIDELNRRSAEELAAFEAARGALVERDLAEPWAPLEEVSVEAVEELEKLQTELSDRERASPKMVAYAQTLEAVRSWKDWVLMGEDGPLWARAPSEWDEQDHASEMLELIAGMGATRMVAGHTPQKSARIRPRFGNRVFLIDTGMLKSEYGGRPSALEICGDAVTAIYLDEQEVLVAPSGAGRRPDDAPRTPGPQIEEHPPPTTRARSYQWLAADGAPLPFQDDAEIERFLATAEVVSTQKIPVGVTKPLKVVLEKDGVRAHAAFKYVDERHKFVSLEIRGRQRLFPVFRDYHLFDCAAYRLDRLLGLGRFPPAVPREIDGRAGTVTLWLEDIIMEKQRRERNLQPPNPGGLAQQRAIMYVFDNIAGNTDSTNVGNALIDRYWKVWFIDCSRCFVTSSVPLTLEAVSRCERSLWRRLNELTDGEIRAALSPYLSKTEVDCVIKRRAAVVAHVAALIDRLGESEVLYDLNPPQTKPVDW